MPTEQHKCPTCGANTTPRTENLTAGLCKTLEMFYTATIRFNRQKLHLQKDLKLSVAANNNFQKLRYFNLVEKTDKGGVWRLTTPGTWFVQGNARCSKQVLVLHNKVVAFGAETVSFSESLGSIPFWLKRADYSRAPGTNTQQIRLF